MSHISADTDFSPPALSIPALFARFLGFGLFAFGGPVAQIAMVRQALVEEERWISPARFNRLLAVMQVLPGPEAHELCVHLGMVARGRIGGIVAGLGFMLPGLLLMLGAGWLYVRFLGQSAAMAPVLLAIQIAVLALIARAVQRIGGHVLKDWLGWAIAVSALAATLAGVPFWLPLLAGAVAGALTDRRQLAVAALMLAAVAAALWWFALPQPANAGLRASAVVAASPLLLFIAGLKGGLLTFGGAYTAIPYVRADTVGRGWLSDSSFLDGVAISNALPAPLVIFATFTGYVVGGPVGALAITTGMFLPAFAFSLIFYERLEALVEAPALHHLLSGVAAAVVGVIAATLVQMAVRVSPSIEQPLVAITLFVAALATVVRFKARWVPLAIIVAAGVAGWAIHP